MSTWKSVRGCMACLKLVAFFSNKLLKKHLAKHRYFEQPHTPGLWRHQSHQIWFNLAVDDFGIKCISEGNLQHLYNALRKETYKIVEDRACELYCGINLKWNYNKGYVNLSMPNYVMKQLTCYAHPAPDRPQHCPFSPNPIMYGRDTHAPTAY
jgi:hypothetical protein